MSRELKFRLWDEIESCWVEHPTLYNRLAIGCDGGVYHGGYDDTVKDRYIIEQWTGVLDKNGKEIYEGDLIIHNNPGADNKQHVHVRWLGEEEGCDYIGWALEDLFTQGGPREIVGNIHEGVNKK